MPVSKTVIINGKDVIVTVEDSARQPCEVWSRIMGYYRPTTEWNVGKISEWKDRKFLRPPPNLPDAQPRLPIEP